MKRAFLAAGAAAAAGWIGYTGVKGRKMAADASAHQPKGGLHPAEVVVTRTPVLWTPPVTASDSGHHLYFELTYDVHTIPRGGKDGYPSGNLKPVDADNAAEVLDQRLPTTLCVAPPSFVASRTAFQPLANCLGGRLALTETPSYGANQQTLRAEQHAPQVFEHGIEAMLKDIAKERPQGQDKPMLVAAGHAAFYALSIAARRPDLVDRVVLLNPTFRGPLPTARADLEAKGKSGVAGFLKGLSSVMWFLYQVPFLNHALNYSFNTTSNIRHQLKSHVYVNPESINELTVEKNQAFARQGPCLPKCAFLVGKADAFKSAEDMQAWLKESIVPAATRDGRQLKVLVMMAEAAPERSTADIAPLKQAAQDHAQIFSFIETHGALRSYEEFPVETAQKIREWQDAV